MGTNGSDGAETGAGEACRRAPGEEGLGPRGEPAVRESPDGGLRPAEKGDFGELTELEREVLAFERRGWPSPGKKERAIRERLELSAPRYYQLLNALLDDPRAWRHDAGTVKRLRERRDAQRQLR
ncbi:DUF3263 domain-containing protein [Streptomyces sulphureus]|uniref:DUF3263 domain-containing protein n=1 Tax=Streptomyces sulphureus TaxID=47758 RepID=UPI0003701D9D|nr:DUF3263 domain-containing protein [Streptomyces sulphureus]